MKSQGFGIRLNGIIGFLMMVGFLILLFFIARGIFRLLTFAAPVLLILAAIINYRTILNYLRWIWSLLRRNPLGGILAILLSVVGFPVLSGFLFGKSILDRRIRKLEKEQLVQRDGEFVDYEEIIRPEREDKLDLGEFQKEKTKQEQNPYKDLF